jgi:hypothetical protein
VDYSTSVGIHDGYAAKKLSAKHELLCC